MEEQTTEIRKTQLTQNDRFLSPAAIGLGILLILGGIVLGLNGNKNKQVANLPEYSPVYVASPMTSPEPTPSPSPSEEPTQAPATADTTVVTQGGTTAGAVLGTTAVKTTTQKVAQTTTASLPNYVPTTSSNNSLPAYQPVVSLPNYEPQYTSPSPSPVQSVSLKVPGASYGVIITGEVKIIEVLNAARSHGLRFATQSYAGLGELVTEMNGQTQSDGRFWTYTVNGSCVPRGISSQTVKHGDQVQFYLTTEAESPCA